MKNHLLYNLDYDLIMFTMTSEKIRSLTNDFGNDEIILGCLLNGAGTFRPNTMRGHCYCQWDQIFSTNNIQILCKNNQFNRLQIIKNENE